MRASFPAHTAFGIAPHTSHIGVGTVIDTAVERFLGCPVPLETIIKALCAGRTAHEVHHGCISDVLVAGFTVEAAFMPEVVGSMDEATLGLER